jgi:MFS family permease
MLMGVVFGSIIGGQATSRTGDYKALGIAGSVLVAIGMILFARMGADTLRSYVVWAMIVAGLGMGLLQPVYTLAVQNVAPRERMGAATSSTIFFRSIGSTVGVAAFGSVMLTRYHNEFRQAIPPNVPAGALPYFENPLLLVQMRPQLERMFAAVPDGSRLLQTMFQSVRMSLTHGLQQIFFWSAVIMTSAILLHLFLKRVPLRRHAPPDSSSRSNAAAAAAALH